MYIDPNISESALDANQRAVIEKYGFEMRDRGGQFELTDPVVRRANRGKGGKHTSGNADLALHAAVAERQAHEKAVAAAPPVAPKGGKKAATKADAAPPAEVVPEPEQQPEPEVQVNADPEIQPETTSEILEPTDGTATGDLVETSGPAETAQPGDEIEVDETDLDNTGKRAKRSKKEEKGPRKDNRYLRAAKIIVDNLEIDAKGLAAVADMSDATAGHCLEALKGVTAALIAKGWLKLPRVRAPKPESAGSQQPKDAAVGGK